MRKTKSAAPAKSAAVAEGFAAAFAAHQAGKLVEAKAGYLEVLARDPSHADAWHLLGGTLLMEGLHDEAEQHIRQALALREDPVFLNNLGKLLHTRKRVAESQAAYRRALELDARNAEAHHLLALLMIEGGRPDDALAQVRASVETAPQDPATHRTLARVLEKLGRLGEAEASLRRADELKPNSAETLFNLGLVLNTANKLAEAEAAYRRCIELRSDSAEVFNGLGVVLQRLRKWDEAETAFRSAVELKPDFAAAINGLGTVFRHRGQLQEAEAAFRRAMQLDPEHLWAYNNLGVLLHDAGRREEAHAQLAKALELKPDSADQRLNIGMTMLASGRFAEGLPLYEARYQRGRHDGSLTPPDLPFPMWQGEPLAGKSLLIWPEQGFGDIIQVARYVPMIRGRGVARLTWACGKSLKPVLERVPGIDEIVDSKDKQSEHDYWCFAMSLPLHLGTELATIPAALPYLSAPPDRIRLWKAKLPKQGLKVGLVWRGSTGHSNDRNRSLPGLATLAPLWTVPGVNFISLQKGAGEDEGRNPPAGQPLLALGHALRDFADTAAVIAQLDLVIGVDTSVIHLSGAMAKPTWVMLPAFGSDWRWLVDREDSPWYPGVMRIFRHKGTRDWATLVERMRAALDRLARDYKPPPPFVIGPIASSGTAATATAKVPKRATPAPFTLVATPTQPIATQAAPDPRAEAASLAHLGNQLRKQGKLGEAEAAFRQALKLDASHAEIEFALANLLRATGQRAQAEASYRRVLELAPKLAKAHNNLAVLLKECGRLAEAETSYRRAIEADPGYAEGHANLGNLLSASQRNGEAKDSYRQAICVRPSFASAHNGLGAVLLGEGQWNEAEACIRRALDLQPGFADAWNNLGTLLQESKRLTESEIAYSRALELKPDFADASNNLGTVLQRTGRKKRAEAAYDRAMALSPGNAQYSSNRATLLADSNDWTHAEAAYRRALALKPDYPDIHNNLGALLQITNRPAEAESAFRQALVLKPDFAEARVNLGGVLLRQGRFEEGWPHYEFRHSQTLRNPTIAVPSLLYPEWKGEPLEGKSLVFWPEQGFGDSIQFARYAPLLKARGVKRLTMVCQPALQSLFESVEGVDAVVSDLRELGPHDYWAFALSLPMRFGTTLDNIPAALPYLRTEPKRVTKWKKRLPPAKTKIGLVWKGAEGHQNDANRSLPSLASLAPLWSTPDTAFVSLQKGRGQEEALHAPTTQPLTALGGEIEDFADTAAIISQLDLVICVDTSIAHLAGALGKHTWVLLSAVGTDWRWLADRTDSPWYPGVMRLVRQAKPGDWAATIEEVAGVLKSLVGQQPVKPRRKRASK